MTRKVESDASRVSFHDVFANSARHAVAAGHVGLLTCGVITRIYPPPANSANAISSIELTPSLLDPGELRPGGREVGTIKIHNRGTTPIRVARFETTCACIRVSPSSLDLRPDEIREITVDFDASEELDFRGVLAVTLVGRSSSNAVFFQTTVGLRVAGDPLPDREDSQ